MALFSDKPPGVQIKGWMTILTTLIIGIDVIAAVSIFLVTNLMGNVMTKYEPLLIYSGDIAASVSRVHTGLYQYLAEFRQDTVQLEAEIVKLRETIGEALKLEAAADVADLREIDVTLEKLQKTVTLLPKIGSNVNWKEVEEVRNTAVALGGKVEELAANMKQHSTQQITEKAQRSRAISSIALYVFVAFLALSVVIIIMLLIWWKDFQEMILQL